MDRETLGFIGLFLVIFTLALHAILTSLLTVEVSVFQVLLAVVGGGIVFALVLKLILWLIGR